MTSTLFTLYGIGSSFHFRFLKFKHIKILPYKIFLFIYTCLYDYSVFPNSVICSYLKPDQPVRSNVTGINSRSLFVGSS